MNPLEIIGLPAEEYQNYKVHLATGRKNNPDGPLYSFYQGNFKKWQEYQTKKNFERPFILSLIALGGQEFLFVGIFESLSVTSKENGHSIYQTKQLELGKEYIGRLVFRFKRTRASYLLLENCADNFELLELKKVPISFDRFTSFENLLLHFQLLETIINKKEESWKIALKSRKGVYLISDKATGKHYVGSAYGEFAFWQRWAEYVKTKHGNNLELKQLIKEKGREYANNFQFSVLETFGIYASDEEIIRREAHWKNVLMSREFGYNSN